VVKVARVLAKGAKVYLMDDPLSNLKDRHRQITRTELFKVHQKARKTVVYVTDDQEEAMALGARVVVMNEGEIQQVGSPEEIYNHPANKFVAGFIGTPAMNMMDVQVGQEGNCAVLMVEGYRQVMPEEMSRPLLEGGYVGKTIILGIRPEDIYGGNKTGAVKTGVAMEGRVHLYEPLRDGVSLLFDFAGRRLAVLTNPETKVRPGDKLSLYPDIERFHFFDKDAEHAIL